MSLTLKSLIAATLATAALCLYLGLCNEAKAGPRNIGGPSPVSGLDLGSGR